VVSLEVRGNDMGKDSTRYITAWAVKKIQYIAEAKAPWQLKSHFPGFKLKKQHLDQPDQTIDLHIGQDNHTIFPTYVADSALEGGNLRLMKTIIANPYLLWGQCAVGERTKHVNELCEHLELMQASKVVKERDSGKRTNEAVGGARLRSVTVDVGAPVKHGATKRREPERCTPLSSASSWADAAEFMPSKACGMATSPRPVTLPLKSESDWVRVQPLGTARRVKRRGIHYRNAGAAPSGGFRGWNTGPGRCGDAQGRGAGTVLMGGAQGWSAGTASSGSAQNRSYNALRRAKKLDMKVLAERMTLEQEAKWNKVKARRLDVAVTIFTVLASILTLPEGAEGFRAYDCNNASNPVEHYSTVGAWSLSECHEDIPTGEDD